MRNKPHYTNLISTQHTFYLLLLFFIAASCGGGKKDQVSVLTDKKVKLQKLKKDQKELNTAVTALEAEIAKLDTSSSNTGKPKLVVLEVLQPSSFSHYVDLQGKIDAENVAYVSPRGMGGQVKGVYVKQGQFVRKGQLLLKLDDALGRSQTDQLQSQLAYAKDLYRRQKNLWDEGIGTEVQLVTARNNVTALEKQISTARQQLAFSNVYAEISGVADEVNIKVGETFTGNPMQGIKIVNTGTLKVVAEVPENYLSKIGVGSSVRVVLPNVNNRIIDTKVKVAGKLINPTTRSFYIEAPIPADPDFRPGQIAIVKIQDYATSGAITVPLNTLQNDENGKYVMVAIKEGGKLIAHKRRVVVGELYGERLEIKSGIQANDVLVAEGFQNLYEGQMLTIDSNVQ
jgi:RND family efflux transporter MFP subunit